MLAAALLVALVLFARRARAMGVDRSDDLLYVVLAAVPGAVVGGRLVHVLVYSGAYAADPRAALDLSVGSLSLLGAVFGGALSAAYIVHLLGGSVRRWADAAALPLLVAIGAGKVAQLAGGGGLGAPFDGPWAVSFAGPGPWHAVDPTTPSHPAQLYEGLWTVGGLGVLAVSERRGALARLGPGSTFGLAVAWWLAGRFLAAFTWSDERVLSVLNLEQALIAAAGLVAGIVLWLRLARASAERRRTQPVAVPASDEDA